MNDKKKTGNCACGHVHFEAALPHDRAILCHCRYCQKRTGSAFGVVVYFKGDQVEFPKDKLGMHEYSTDSGNMMQSHFCTKCGTSMFITGDILTGIIGVAGGCFDDDPFWYELDREVFCRSKAKFVQIDAPISMETSPRYKPV